MASDHGTGQGGDLVDFTKEHYCCDYKDAMAKLREYLNAMEPTMRVKTSDRNPSLVLDNTDKHIQIVTERPIEKYYLKQYIKQYILKHPSRKSVFLLTFRITDYGRKINFPNINLKQLFILIYIYSH